MAIGTGAAILGASVIGGIGSAIGGSKQARAAEGAAKEQAGAAAQQLDFAKQSQERAIRAAESPQQLAALERQMGTQERQLQRSEKFLSNIDPALVEASQQALSLLRGEESGALAPLRNQRKKQRESLLNNLRRQLGPGAETSSAGIQALTQFDEQTASVLSGAQQQTLGRLLGSAQQSAGMGRQTQANLGQLGLGAAGQFGSMAGRRVGAITGTQGAIGQAGQQVVGSAGSQFVGAQLRGQQQSQFFGGLAQAGITAGLGQLGKGSGVSTQVQPGFAGTVDPKFGSIA